MAIQKLTDTVSPDKIINTDKEEGTIPFFVITDKYGIAVDDVSYMIVERKQASRRIEDEMVETYYKYTPIKWYSTFVNSIQGLRNLLESKQYQTIIKSNDWKSILRANKEVDDLLLAALRDEEEVMSKADYIQQRQDLLNELHSLRTMKEAVEKETEDLLTLIKESRKIIVDQTDRRKK